MHTYQTIKRTLKTSIFPTLALLVSGCGGGGGGGDETFIGAANVIISVSPSRIDSGDQMEVAIEISEVHKNGIALKIRYPKGLDYVTGSSFLETGEEDEEDVTPSVITSNDDDVYVVYFLSQDQFNEDNNDGTIFLRLEGRDEIEEGKIEVDADVDDPLIDNSVEFNVENPQFGAEDEADISVID